MSEEVFKIVARDVHTGRQYKKWTYVGREKFDRYSPEIIQRYTEPRWDKREFCIEIYDMYDGDWRLIVP